MEMVFGRTDPQRMFTKQGYQLIQYTPIVVLFFVTHIIKHKREYKRHPVDKNTSSSQEHACLFYVHMTMLVTSCLRKTHFRYLFVGVRVILS